MQDWRFVAGAQGGAPRTAALEGIIGMNRQVIVTVSSPASDGLIHRLAFSSKSGRREKHIKVSKE